MGKAYECDTCKKLFSGECKNKISVTCAETKINYSTPKSYELCGKCFSKIGKAFGIHADGDDDKLIQLP